MIFSPHCALSTVCLRFLLFACKTQNINISQLLMKYILNTVSKQPPLWIRSGRSFTLGHYLFLQSLDITVLKVRSTDWKPSLSLELFVKLVHIMTFFPRISMQGLCLPSYRKRQVLCVW